jgi:hypothetical protein
MPNDRPSAYSSSVSTATSITAPTADRARVRRHPWAPASPCSTSARAARTKAAAVGLHGRHARQHGLQAREVGSPADEDGDAGDTDRDGEQRRQGAQRASSHQDPPGLSGRARSMATCDSTRRDVTSTAQTRPWTCRRHRGRERSSGPSRRTARAGELETSARSGEARHSALVQSDQDPIKLTTDETNPLVSAAMRMRSSRPCRQSLRTPGRSSDRPRHSRK